MSQPAHPTFINLPQPPSNPDTPSEVPGTPTSTTTSLSALSTTAIKDGHRGALHHRGHHHSPSTNSLEAERADRISRLTGLSGVSALRGPPTGVAQQNANLFQSTATPAGFSPNPVAGAAAAAAAAGALAPAFFDAAGQPVAATKVSTVGSASATESVGGRTNVTEVGGDHSALGEEEERDEDMLTEMDSVSASGYMGGAGDAMDEDLDNIASQSVGGFDDRMSDDGNASLVGFGEGAGSTLSGPIYHRRPLPGGAGGSSAAGPATALPVWGLERSSSGLSEGATASPHHQAPFQAHHHGGAGSRRDFAPRPLDREPSTDTPVSQSAVRERREARMMDGVALDSGSGAGTAAPSSSFAADGDDVFIDTTTRGPVPVQLHPQSHSQSQSPATVATGNARERQLQQQQQRHPRQSHAQQAWLNDTAERTVHDRLDEGEARGGATALGVVKGGEQLGQFQFEER